VIHIPEQEPLRTLILGAGGRDFHNFLQYFKNNPKFKVLGFTADQIPGIEKRKFPKELASPQYKHDIPIFLEKELPEVIKNLKIDYAFLCYSDLSHHEVGDKASIVLANGANFALLGPKATQLKSKLPVISVCAVRTGCGKSRITRKIAMYLKRKGHHVVVIRHPMPYGDLKKQEVQKFYTYEDLNKANCTLEEREEYEHHIRSNIPVFAGVNYEKIMHEAEKEADVILWDGGNNDFPFIKPDLHIVLVDPRRPGHGLSYYPGEVNLRTADIVIVNHMYGVLPEQIKEVEKNTRLVNKKARLIEVKSLVIVKEPALIKGKRVLIVGDGPTLTHGGMPTGVGTAAAVKYHARKIIDPRPYAVGSIKETFKKFPHLQNAIPAMGYSKKQLKELEQSINRTPCDIIIDATPGDISRLIKIKKKMVYTSYDMDEHDMLPIFREIEKIVR